MTGEQLVFTTPKIFRPGANVHVAQGYDFADFRLIGEPTSLPICGTEVVLYPTRGGETPDALMIYLPASGLPAARPVSWAEQPIRSAPRRIMIPNGWAATVCAASGPAQAGARLGIFADSRVMPW